MRKILILEDNKNLAQTLKIGLTQKQRQLTLVDSLKHFYQILEKGADDYLAKPFSLAELRLKVKNMLQWDTLVKEEKPFLKDILWCSINIKFLISSSNSIIIPQYIMCKLYI